MSACLPTRDDHTSRSPQPSSALGIKRPHSPPTPPPGRRFHIRGADLSASITVFLIAVPMSLGLAVAMGAPLEAGLVAAAIGGIVAGLLGGTPLQVTGPSAGLTVVTAELIQLYGWRTTCAITIGAGLLQLLLGSLGAARSALAVSPAIVHGTLAGIGVAIALAQLHIVLGGSPQSSVIDNVLALPAQMERLSPAAPLIGALTVTVLVLWPRLPGRVGQRVRRIPAALASVVIATAVAAAATPTIARVDLPSWRAHAFPELPQGPVLALATAVFTVMLVASLESLLAAVAVDKLATDRDKQSTGPASDRSAAVVRVKRSDLDRELRGQGIANTVAGLFGGLPVSGGAVRGSANVRAGATGRAATVMHGVWVLLAAGLLITVLERIPLAALAALVMVVGTQMVSFAHIRNVHKHREFPVYAATLAGVVLAGVLKGVAIGITVAVGLALHRLARTRITVSVEGGRHRVRVRGQLTFLAVPRLSRTLGRLPQGTNAVVELDGFFMDHAAYETIQDWSHSQAAHGGRIVFTGTSGGRIAEPAAAAHSCCRPWTPWRNHHCHDRPVHDATTNAFAATVEAAVSAGARTEVRAHTPRAQSSPGTPRPARPGTSTSTSTSTSGENSCGTTSDRGTSRPEKPHPGTALRAIAAQGTTDTDVPSGTGASDRRTASADTTAGTPAGGSATDSAPRRTGAHRLLSGLSSFQRTTAPLVREELARLATEGQQPSQLFITCADSRLVTSMITASGPGDLFTVRNVGNLVPPPGTPSTVSSDDSVAAAIEYAVDVLEVESITVCGHSGCGAMQALLGARPDPPATPLWRWLRHGMPSLRRMDSRHHSWARISGRLPTDAVEQLCLTNVVQQLDHLRAHDSVARRLAEGRLQLQGMYFHVGEAQAYLLTEGASSGTGPDEVFDLVAPATDDRAVLADGHGPH